MFMVIGDLGLLCELLGLLLGGSVDYGCVVVLAADGWLVMRGYVLGLWICSGG